MLSHYMWHYAPDLKDGQPEIVADPYPATEGQLFFVDACCPNTTTPNATCCAT